MKWVLLLTVLGACSAAAESPRVEFDSQAMRRATALDLNAELGSISSDRAPWARVRVGKMWLREPHVFSLGLSLEGGFRRSVALGAQGEWTHLQSGIWVQGTLGVEPSGRMFAHPSLGWSVFGIERRSVDESWLFKLRIPIGVILALL